MKCFLLFSKLNLLNSFTEPKSLFDFSQYVSVAVVIFILLLALSGYLIYKEMTTCERVQDDDSTARAKSKSSQESTVDVKRRKSDNHGKRESIRKSRKHKARKLRR